jgi:hypothetical protein
MLKRHQEKHKRLMYAAGTIAAAVINCAPRGEGAKVWSASDFVPDYDAKQEEVPQTDEEMIKSMAKFFGVGPGKPN